MQGLDSNLSFLRPTATGACDACDMEPLIISHTTALEGIRRARFLYGDLPWEVVEGAAARRILDESVPNARNIDVEALKRESILADDCIGPIDVFCLSKNRRRNPLFRCHCTSKTPKHLSLLSITHNVYCIAPAHALAQALRGFSIASAVSHVMELTGSYALPPLDMGNDQSARYHLSPAITPKELKPLVQHYRSANDSSFCHAATYALAGSASPFETIVFAMLCLPAQYGGFGCGSLPGGALLNHTIEFDLDARIMSSGMPYAICDLYFPLAKIDFEYNGATHDLDSSHLHDNRRNNGLRSMGIEVINIARNQVTDLEALEAMARMVHRDAGKRFRYSISGYRTRQQNLLHGLLQWCNHS